MFNTVAELVALAEEKGSVAETMIQQEIEHAQVSRNDILKHMLKNLQVMKNSVEKGVSGVTSVTKLTGNDARRLNQYISEKETVSDTPILKAVRNAIAVNEVNAQMGLICANPTAGSAGVVAGVVTALTETKQLSMEQQLDFLFTAGAFGLIIANRASISGAAGGCQAEIGSASAMASAAIVTTMGGTPKQAANALAITLKNMLGLICDPVAGLVEVPCVKRNALGASQAFISADMALAGIESVIPPDEVIEALNNVGKQLPSIFKETAEGGLARTLTGIKIEQQIFGNKAK